MHVVGVELEAVGQEAVEVRGDEGLAVPGYARDQRVVLGRNHVAGGRGRLPRRCQHLNRLAPVEVALEEVEKCEGVGVDALVEDARHL